MQELTDYGRLLCLLKEEAVMAVRGLNHMKVNLLAESEQRFLDLPGRSRRVQPVGAERDQECASRDACKRALERAGAVLPGEVEIGECARRIQIGVGVEPLHERVGLVPQ